MLPVLVLYVSMVFAQSTDAELSRYVEMMQLKSISAPPAKREALYQLGLRLFYDNQLSGKENISCHACHSLAGFSADTLPLAVGEGASGLAKERQQDQGLIIPRHTPALWNLGVDAVTSYFWDGRVRRHLEGGWQTPEPKLNGPNPELKEIAQTFDSLLAVQAVFPITSPEEMLGQGSTLSKIEAWNAAMERILNGRLGASYKRFFREAFPGVEKFNIAHVGNALAELQRHHFKAINTPWDNYLNGEKKFMTERMKKGAVLFFGKASCSNCHNGEHLSNFGFLNIGIPQIGPGITNEDDQGRIDYRFRTAPLRNIALTAPYMHTGVFANMWEVIEHYNHPMRSLHHFNWNPVHPRYRQNLNLDQRRETMMARTKTLAPNLPRNLGLSEDEKKDLYCFLMVGLTDLKNQKDLLGVFDEVDDCSPRLFN